MATPTITLVEIDETSTKQQLLTYRELVQEFLTELTVDLSYQSVQVELDALPGRYSREAGGCLFMLVDNSENDDGTLNPHAFGCAGLRDLGEDVMEDRRIRVAEIKRMYLKPSHRGRGYSHQLLSALIDRASKSGYDKVRLDTLIRLRAANALYTKAGFYPIPAYCENPFRDAVFLEYQLKAV